MFSWYYLKSCFSPQGDAGDLGLPGAVGEKVSPHVSTGLDTQTGIHAYLQTLYLHTHCHLKIEGFSARCTARTIYNRLSPALGLKVNNTCAFS